MLAHLGMQNGAGAVNAEENPDGVEYLCIAGDRQQWQEIGKTGAGAGELGECATIAGAKW